METIDQLRIVIQISISLAGFSGIVAAFQYREGTRITRGDTFGLVLLVNVSLIATFFAVLPMVLLNFTIKESTVWAFCSAVLSVDYIIFLIYIKSSLKHIHIRRSITRWTHRLFFLLGIVTIIVCILNAVGLVFHHEPGPYIACLLTPLIATSYMFARLVSRPLWRAIRQQEREDS